MGMQDDGDGQNIKVNCTKDRLIKAPLKERNK